MSIIIADNPNAEYEKELEVAPFNKKEIFSIVNEGIEKGQVNVGSGGGSLYYHEIMLRNSGRTHWFIVNAISKQSTPITKVSDVLNFLFYTEGTFTYTPQKVTYQPAVPSSGGNSIDEKKLVLGEGKGNIAEGRAWVEEKGITSNNGSLSFSSSVTELTEIEDEVTQII